LPLWHWELSMWRKKLPPVCLRRNRRFSYCNTGSTSVIKYSCVNVWPCGNASRTTSRVSVNKTVIMVFLAWILCSHLGGTASREAANIESDWYSYRNHDSSSVEIPSKALSPQRWRMARRARESRTRLAFWSSDRVCGTQRRENFLRPSWWLRISLIVWWEVRKCLDICRALAKGNCIRKVATDEPKSDGGRPSLGSSSHVATPVLNRITYLSMAERLCAESCKTDVNSAYINRLSRPFITKYLMRIFCFDFSILIFKRRQKWDEEELSVSSDRNRITKFPCQYVKVQLMLYILPPSNPRWGLAISA
jgi:hypothetical protein